MRATDYVLLKMPDGKEVIAKELGQDDMYLDPLTITVLTNGYQSSYVMTRYSFFAQDNLVQINPAMVVARSEPTATIIIAYELFLKVIRSKTDPMLDDQWREANDALETTLNPPAKKPEEEGSGGSGDDAHLQPPPEAPEPEEAEMLNTTKKINSEMN